MYIRLKHKVIKKQIMMIKTKTKYMFKDFLLWKIWKIMILKTTLNMYMTES